MATPYRADQVGSLLRPPALLEARTAHAESRLSADGLRAAEDQAVLDALAMQREVGLDVYSDGELRRGAWMTDMADAVDGFVPAHVTLNWRGPSSGAAPSASRIVGGRLQPRRRLTAHELPVLKEHAPGPIKMTVPAPSNFLVASYKPGVSDQFYSDRAELADDLARIIRAEIEWLIGQGVPYIQLDAPFYSVWVDSETREGMRQRGGDPARTLDECLAADNASVHGLAGAGITLAMHICRGNSRSRWIAEGGYEPIAEKLFGGLNVDTLLLEYDTERAGGFEPLRFVPPGTTVVLGLVTSKEPALESMDTLRRRIDEAARYVPLENLALSPQCGFASVAAGNLLTLGEQRRKLQLVAETARKVWG
jgi:5-methyltetrahydropteroyltriglutamate--homocysteine methyltransferase